MKQSVQMKLNNIICEINKKINHKYYEFGMLHQIFFYLFLFSIPLQTRVIFLTDNTYVTNGFIEYNAKFLYLSDILLIITFILYIVNLFHVFIKEHFHGTQQVIHNNISNIQKLNNKKSLSRVFSFFISSFKYLVNVSREAIYKKEVILLNPISWLIIFLLYSLISISWSTYPEISLFRNLKIIEFGFLSFYIYLTFNSINKIIPSLYILIFTANIQSIIAFFQMIYQKSIGLKIFGESLISPDILGVAKILINNEKIIRAYGTFPHPNIFAGFVLLSIIFLIIIFIYNCYKYDSRSITSAIKIINKYLLITFISLNFVLILTFSRSSWIAIFIAYTIVIFWIKNNYIVLKDLKIKPYILIILIPLLLTLPSVYNRISPKSIDINGAISDRIYYTRTAISMFTENPIRGFGIGTFVPQMIDFTNNSLQYWLYQPVHNIYLLILVELGLIGFCIFLIMLNLLFFYNQRKKILFSVAYRMYYKLLHVKQNIYSNKLTNKTISINESILLLFKLILFSFLLIGLFDHYFITIQQGQIMFWLIVGYILALNKIREVDVKETILK